MAALTSGALLGGLLAAFVFESKGQESLAASGSATSAERCCGLTAELPALVAHELEPRQRAGDDGAQRGHHLAPLHTPSANVSLRPPRDATPTT
jgi:hypothetical protein